MADHVLGPVTNPDPRDDIQYLALCAIPALGPVTVRRLMRAFGSAGAVFKAKSGELMSVEGISEKRAAWVKQYGGLAEFEQAVEKIYDDGGRVVLHGHEGYPAALEFMGQDAPLLLYVRGAVNENDRHAVAVVGARLSSIYGQRMTTRIAGGLAAMGITVISGLARGIDTIAHSSAIDSGGRTIGVLGCGIDVVYPSENRRLFAQVAENGAVISEFPPGTPPLKEHFPRRNRIISALSLGVVVVEAAKGSGSLITAGHALEQGKEVFAVPGEADSKYSQGAHELLRQGARIVTSAEDVIAELAGVLKGFIRKRRDDADAPKPALTQDEGALCALLSGKPSHIDDIARQAGIAVNKVLGLLLALELKGVVKQAEGKRFYLA